MLAMRPYLLRQQSEFVQSVWLWQDGVREGHHGMHGRCTCMDAVPMNQVRIPRRPNENLCNFLLFPKEGP